MVQENLSILAPSLPRKLQSMMKSFAKTIIFHFFVLLQNFEVFVRFHSETNCLDQKNVEKKNKSFNLLASLYSKINRTKFLVKYQSLPIFRHFF